MTLSEIKKKLIGLETISFVFPNGELVPEHFHVTEIGEVSKNFIDCGGTFRRENKINFQLWNANDYNHRLHPEKLLSIINLSEKTLNLQDSEIEVEFQGEFTIQKFGLDFKNNAFTLTSLVTDCLAKENCGIPEKPKLKLSTLQEQSSCSPDSGCC